MTKQSVFDFIARFLADFSARSTFTAVRVVCSKPVFNMSTKFKDEFHLILKSFFLVVGFKDHITTMTELFHETCMFTISFDSFDASSKSFPHVKCPWLNFTRPVNVNKVPHLEVTIGDLLLVLSDPDVRLADPLRCDADTVGLPADP